MDEELRRAERDLDPGALALRLRTGQLSRERLEAAALLGSAAAAEVLGCQRDEASDWCKRLRPHGRDVLALAAFALMRAASVSMADTPGAAAELVARSLEAAQACALTPSDEARARAHRVYSAARAAADRLRSSGDIGPTEGLLRAAAYAVWAVRATKIGEVQRALIRVESSSRRVLTGVDTAQVVAEALLSPDPWRQR